ncbi:Methylmalonic aciduria (Cobalamin deficiency) cblB type [Fasciolopsis buskii]|uniref:Corrinoid adenosyltransferase MMAB n=1 Tax=Fasciolopsis buskii TaxID=27845 RepID=A0A8E0RTC3_9TREM|nr:Methylmalonic aciduria (Cobalamin deficiency) cblB type [Fasciolopsis buski]
MKIYTGTGDKGTSALFTGERRPKTDIVFEALGAVDELTSIIAMALAEIDLYANREIQSGYSLQKLCDQLDLIQRRLQALLSSVATPIPSSSDPEASEKRRARFEHVNFPEGAAVELEGWIDSMTEVLPPLRQFILPSGGTPGTTLHFARSVCRRAERRIVALNEEQVTIEAAATVYMNRLSDYLFTAARYVSCALKFPEKPSVRHYPGDELGRGAGKGGGTGGTIRDAGGAFGKRQAGKEEEYFHRKVTSNVFRLTCIAC